MRNNFDFEEINEINYKTPKSKKMLIITSLTSVFVLGSIGFLLLNKPKQSETIERDKIIVKTKSEDKQVSTVELQYSPIELPDFLKKTYTELTPEDEDAMIAYSSNNFIGWNSNIFPSEADGFTSDKNKEYDKDGLPNPNYVAMTGNDLNKALSYSIYRIINPIFGDWKEFQGPTFRDISEVNEILYRDLAGLELQSQLSTDNYPRLFNIDYNKDNYGGALEDVPGERLAKFIGIIKEGNISYSDNKIDVNLTVDYMKSKDELYETKKLTLNFEIIDGELKLQGGKVNE